ncbi:MAG: transcription termination factor Rho [Lachnospiraceae bacterium]|nr:transcription termination factor Rho [Lachnospiraceae bacterium]
MREKYESLSVAVLRDLAKSRGITGTSTMKKAQLVEVMLEQDEIDAEKKEKSADKAVEAKSDSVKKDAEVKNGSAKDKAVADKKTRGRKKSEDKTEHKSDHEKNTSEEEKNHSESERREIPDDAKACGGILEVMSDGFGFIRCENYLPGENDVYVSPSQIRKFNLKTGDIIVGKTRKNNPNDKFGALMLMTSVNGFSLEEAQNRPNFEDMTPVFPYERIKLEKPNSSVAMRIVDLVSPIGKGQRGMIVSQPKAGKTTLLKEIAKSVTDSYPDMHLIILLIDERPEEVTDIKEAIEGENVEVIYSTFDELPEHHKRVSEMVLGRAKRLVEHKQDVMILLDSITRLSRAYNLTVPPSGRTLSGGLDPAALHMPKKFFGAARKMREGGSLTILATALVDTGSKMDDVVFEEFKGTGNMELILDRKLSEKRVFPAIDIVKSGTRRDDLLLNEAEKRALDRIHRGVNGMKRDEAVEQILNMFAKTKSNADVVAKLNSRPML